MKTPIADFIRDYSASDTLRLHVPGHKGRGPLGCEAQDITEINGADSLFEASGIIAESEENASALFGSGRTLYSAEGSSLCIRAMVYLALTCRRQDTAPVLLAARNAHKSLIYAAALTGAEIAWLWPEGGGSLLSCPVTPCRLDKALSSMDAPPAAVYVTSPDYLGGVQDIAGLAAVCRSYDVPLLVDNAHGAYMRFLDPPLDALTLGAAMCCQSAHKTLPALTGGAYLHISKDAPGAYAENARAALALFGSTSPSYLMLQSLDLCNRYIAEGYPARLAATAAQAEDIRARLRANGWQAGESDPLRVTLRGDGQAMAARLRTGGMEPEFSDRDFLVMMLTPENDPAELARIPDVMGRNVIPAGTTPELPPVRSEAVCAPREALFSPHELIPASEALGRICGAPSVSCPPAVPPVVCGERIGPEAMELFSYYGIEYVDVLK